MLGTEAVSFCNALFLGNLVAGGITFPVFGPRKITRDLAASNRPTSWLLLLNALFAIVISMLLFKAIENTSVTNVVLLGRFESVAFALLSASLLHTRIARAEWMGYGVVILGITVIVLHSQTGA
ncbi:MAG: drug/metabolite transporter (DMT)-like permease [Planctomycetota bacterium]|jgi:drug/metabolite transporter (DMT)-like permease